MGMGQHCKCHLCDFDFWSGHSHHGGNSRVLCKACLAEFVLPTESPCGPQIGELIVLQKCCVSRQRRDSMALDFEDGQHCPKCSDGILNCSAVEY
jgi:hypothetical protein